MINEIDARFLQALHVLLILVQQAAVQTTPVASRFIAQTLDLSPRAVEPILVKMAQAQIIKSVRGVKGGYVLARERRRILLSDIFTAVIGVQPANPNVPLALQVCISGARAAYTDALAQYSLEDMVRQSALLPVCGSARGDFSI